MKTAREIAQQFGECRRLGDQPPGTKHSIECNERTEVARVAQIDALRFAVEQSLFTSEAVEGKLAELETSRNG